MFGTLTHCSETELLDYVQLILSKPGPLTHRDCTELDQINTELCSRSATQATQAVVNGV